jgi:hypothetical protein
VGLKCDRKRCSNLATQWHANNIIGRGVIDANETIKALGTTQASGPNLYGGDDWRQFLKCDDLKMSELCLTTCNHGYFMKDNPVTGSVMTFSNHYDMRILYDESQMSTELGLQIGYFSVIRNSNLKSIIIPDETNHATQFRIRVRMHYCSTINSESIGLEIKNPSPIADYSPTATASSLQYCFPKICAPL